MELNNEGLPTDNTSEQNPAVINAKPEKKQQLWLRRCPYCDKVIKGSEEKIFELMHCPSCNEILHHEAVVWYRRTGHVSTLAFLTFLGFGILTVLPLCIICATGDVYSDNYDEFGALKKWSKVNRYIAMILLPILALWVTLFILGQLNLL